MDKKQQELKQLLSKYLENSASYEEKQRLYSIFTEPISENDIKTVLYTLLQDFKEKETQHEQINFDEIYNKILNEISLREKRKNENLRVIRRVRIRNIFTNLVKIAAIFIIAFFIGYFINNQSPNNSLLPQIAFYEIKAPLGSRSEIQLPDGSIVKLNAGSAIKYANNYNQNNRTIILEGEAYFKVAKNKEIPFIVNTKGVNIRAVGTEFNVKAYKDENTIETTVVEGKVEIEKNKENNEQKIVLNVHPNQKAIFVKEEATQNIEEVIKADPLIAKTVKSIDNTLYMNEKQDVTPVVAWTSGKLVFRGETLENISIKLSRKYDVKIEFVNEEAKNFKFSGTLEDETLEQVMAVVSLISPINFAIDKKTVQISTNKRQAGKYQQHLRNTKEQNN